MSAYRRGDIRKLYGPYRLKRKRPHQDRTGLDYFMEKSNVFFMETPDGDAEYLCPGDCEGGDECTRTSSVPAAFEGKEFLSCAGGFVMRPPEDFSKYMCAGTRHPDDTTSEPYRGKRKFTIITEQMASVAHFS